jgi:hypothetical protein
MPGLLVLTGITGIDELLRCPPRARPDLVGRDLGALLVAHPEAFAEGGVARCEGAAVAVREGALAVDEPGEDALDLLRAACAAAWSLQASGSEGEVEVDPGPVVSAVRRLEPGAAWAR